MTFPDTASVTQRLMNEFEYPEQGAGMVAEQIAALVPPLRAAFSEWWETGTMPHVEVEGYTVERLRQEHSLNPLAALLTLDWLAREPEAARAAIGQGHDEVG
jgi:hypothetical protein